MQNCQKGRELLLDLQRSDWLPTFDEAGVRAVISEMTELWGKILTIFDADGEIDDAAKVTLVYHHQCLSRNKKYMIAYFLHRLSKIRQCRWESGALMPNPLKEIVSMSEYDYFNDYGSLLNQYTKSMDGLDLTSNVEPPKELYVEVRITKDCGEIMTDAGPVMLDAGSTHFIKRTDIESFIRQGLAQQI